MNSKSERSVQERIGNTVRALVGKVLRPLGVDLVPIELARPCAWGSQRIWGSFPPLLELCQPGTKQNYHIHDGYHHRSEAIYFDDTRYTDQSQLEVYRFAKELCQQRELSNVFDIGCGSGYKLIKFLGDLKTVGVDVEQTCRWLRRKYPGRSWIEPTEMETPAYPVDLVIASDVIEHLVNPDELMASISGLQPRFIILSTPDRNL